MKSVSRRNFFLQFYQDVSERFGLNFVKHAAAQMPPALDWFAVGRIAEMVPGASVRSFAGEVSVILHSNQIGVRAEIASKNYIALRAETNGTLLAQPGTLWPASRVLSHISNQPLDLDKDQKRGDFYE